MRISDCGFRNFYSAFHILHSVIRSPHRLARPRTPAFHVGNRGSNPLGDAKEFQGVSNLANPFIFAWWPNSDYSRFNFNFLYPLLGSRVFYVGHDCRQPSYSPWMPPPPRAREIFPILVLHLADFFLYSTRILLFFASKTSTRYPHFGESEGSRKTSSV